ncbi:MAG: S41 family peptidase [Bacteroidota bacterium]
MNYNKSLIGLLLVLIFSPVFVRAQDQDLFEISKNLDVFTSLYKQIDLNYVETVKPGELMKTGIDAMLATLDPYTNYIPESEIEDYRFMTTGQYGGIGATIHKKGDFLFISEPYKNSPADKAGLIAGDKVLEINGTSTRNRSVDDASNFLRGQPGNAIKLLVQRGESKPYEINLNRENIQVENIPYFGMLDDHIGYLKMNGFTQNSGNEVKETLMKLKSQGKLKALVFDLRGNGGGLLNEAVNIANLFIDRDQLIVSTKGRLASANISYKTMMPAADKDIPLVFLVDKNSASASEILAGTMQDLDRAVIIGQRSYGKGLVQNVLPLSYNSQVKVTVAKYYIPSGRCIQAIDYSHKDAEGNFGKIPDSLITAFKTKSGRIVYDGGGIEPDVYLSPNRYSDIVQNLLSKYLIFDFATKFKTQHDSISGPRDFKVTDVVYNDFVSFVKDKGYDDFVTPAEASLEEMKKNAEKENDFAPIQEDYLKLKQKIAQLRTQSIYDHKAEISKLIRDEIVTRYYYERGRVEASLAADPAVMKAKETLDNEPYYKGILDGTVKVKAELKPIK